MRVLYIGGLGRSGSTLLDRMIGQLPGFFSAGEIRDLWQRGLIENRLCGCGKAFRECEVWRRVGEEAFGGWDRLDVDEVATLAKAVDRHSLLPLLAFPGLWPSFERKVRRYGALLAPLYEAIRSVTGKGTIIDSSKAPSTAFLLRRMPGVDLSAVHLIRDSRAVAYSWSKRILRPDTPGRVVYMHRYAPSRVAVRWITRNAMMEALGRMRVPEVRVRYEDLVASPRAELERILGGLGVEHRPEDLSFISNGHVQLEANHTVMGNPMRLDTGPVKLVLDDRWRTAFGPRPRGMVTTMTLPLLRRYRYQP